MALKSNIHMFVNSVKFLNIIIRNRKQYRAYIKTAKNGSSCEELLSENDFHAVLATFCFYDHGANASKAVQKIATDQREYHKCSSWVIIC